MGKKRYTITIELYEPKRKTKRKTKTVSTQTLITAFEKRKTVKRSKSKKKTQNKRKTKRKTKRKSFVPAPQSETVRKSITKRLAHDERHQNKSAQKMAEKLLKQKSVAKYKRDADEMYPRSKIALHSPMTPVRSLPPILSSLRRSRTNKSTQTSSKKLKRKKSRSDSGSSSEKSKQFSPLPDWSPPSWSPLEREIASQEQQGLTQESNRIQIEHLQKVYNQASRNLKRAIKESTKL